LNSLPGQQPAASPRPQEAHSGAAGRVSRVHRGVRLLQSWKERVLPPHRRMGGNAGFSIPEATMRNIIRVALVLILCAFSGGCGTTQSAWIGEFTPFAGTKLDTWIAENYPSDRALAVLDWPFSLIADAVLLPITVLLYPYAFFGKDEDQRAY
jgi:uncharacterized protein YceK